MNQNWNFFSRKGSSCVKCTLRIKKNVLPKTTKKSHDKELPFLLTKTRANTKNRINSHSDDKRFTSAQDITNAAPSVTTD